MKTKSGVRIIPLVEILYVKTYTPYAYLHLSDNTKIFSGESIRYFESKLHSYGFLRINKSVSVNVCTIESYDKQGDGSLLLQDGRELN